MTSIYEIPSPYLELLAGLLGLCVGSFLNVVVLRSLAEKSLWKPASHCPHCQHNLGIGDLIPLLSYCLLKGKCRYCQASIHWHYPAVELLTAVVFILVVHFFGDARFEVCDNRSSIALYMLVFASTLIATTVTDFKEKLIPHDITYPMILVGIFFSAAFRHDLLGTLAGVGASYILFDFIAHYGLVVYKFMHPELSEESADSAASDKDDNEVDEELDRAFDLPAQPNNDYEPLEVMGGADAVMAALIAAWLGWERLVMAVIVAFVVGAIMGAYYLVAELRRRGELHTVMKPALIGFSILFALPFIFVALMAALMQAQGGAFIPQLMQALSNPAFYIAALALGTGGATMGVISTGLRVTETFPFGPALAVGAAYAMSTIDLRDNSFIKPGA